MLMKLHLKLQRRKGCSREYSRKTATISEVIEQVVSDQGLNRGDLLELVYKGEVLQPTKNTLTDFGLAGVVQLDLVATGEGV